MGKPEICTATSYFFSSCFSEVEAVLLFQLLSLLPWLSKEMRCTQQCPLMSSPRNFRSCVESLANLTKDQMSHRYQVHTNFMFSNVERSYSGERVQSPLSQSACSQLCHGSWPEVVNEYEALQCQSLHPLRSCKVW